MVIKNSKIVKFCCKGNDFFAHMQEKSPFKAIFQLFANSSSHYTT